MIFATLVEAGSFQSTAGTSHSEEGRVTLFALVLSRVVFIAAGAPFVIFSIVAYRKNELE